MILFGAILIFLGSFVTFIAAIGIVKFEGVFLRLHAASKSASLGLVLMLAGTLFFFPELGVFLIASGVILLVLLKTPVATQAIARAAYFINDPRSWRNVAVDEWHGRTSPTETQGQEASESE